MNRIDHLMVCPLGGLEAGTEQFRRLGFSVHDGGSGAKGTHNAIAFMDQDYLELLYYTNKQDYLSASPGGSLASFIEEGAGLRFLILQCSDIDTFVKVLLSLPLLKFKGHAW